MKPSVLAALAGLGLIALVIIGLSQTHVSDRAPGNAAPSAAVVGAAFAGSPPVLAALHGQANELLPGSTQTIRARLAQLRGYPVIINKWASWCPPCRGEFPLLQRAAVRLGRRVAFVGIDVTDNSGDARSFLRSFPVTYPSYSDPSAHLSIALGAGLANPTTVFLDRNGRTTFLKQGAFRDQAELDQDIERYLLRA